MQSMEHLIDYLGRLPEGPVADTCELERLLAECWHEFAGDYGGMKPQKLFGRMENVRWRPPILRFVIERHGGTALGSTRAEMQYWDLDVEHRTLTMDVSGYRQVIPRAVPLDVRPIAEEIADLVLNRARDNRLKWSKKGHVQVLIGRILPEGSAFKQTLLRRRSRLSNAICRQLTARGWQLRANAWFAPPDDSG